MDWIAGKKCFAEEVVVMIQNGDILEILCFTLADYSKIGLHHA